MDKKSIILNRDKEIAILAKEYIAAKEELFRDIPKASSIPGKFCIDQKYTEYIDINAIIICNDVKSRDEKLCGHAVYIGEIIEQRKSGSWTNKYYYIPFSINVNVENSDGEYASDRICLQCLRKELDKIDLGEN